jgi:hypothetical protein
MLEQYCTYRKSLYKDIGTKAVVKYQSQRMLERLQSTKSPCDPNLWFTTFTCPQIVADSYERPVIVYTYVVNANKDGVKKENHEAQIFFPLLNMKLIDSHNPHYPYSSLFPLLQCEI